MITTSPIHWLAELAVQVRSVAGGTVQDILMNWPLAECLQYRSAYWIIEGREIRLINDRQPPKFSHLLR